MNWVAIVAALAVPLAGCVDADFAGGEDEAGHTSQPGEVSAQQQSNGRWIARRTDSAEGAFASGGDVRAVTVNGAVSVGVGSHSGFTAKALLWAYGDSETEARDRLEAMRLRIGSGADAQVTAPDWHDRGGDAILRVPVGDVGDVTAKTTNGAITIDDLQASTVDADTSNGAIDCDVSAQQLALRTTNGAITCTATVRDADLSTSNGQIDVELRPSGTGTWDLDTTNGAIDLQVVEDSGIGYDVRGETTNGGITFDFSDTETVSSQSTFTGGSRHERTHGFSSRAIQTTITLDTGNGSIEAGS